MKKGLLKFKIIFVLALLWSSMSDATILFKEDIKITLDLKQVAILEVLSEIERITEFTFFYKNEDVNLNTIVTIKLSETPINLALAELFKEKPITFKIIKNQIVLKKKNLHDNHNQELQILCKVIDYKTKTPLSFATIRVKNTSLGVIADDKGQFRVPYKYKQNNDTIIISSIGYKTKEIAVNNLKDRETNIIGIETKIETLAEVDLENNKKRLSIKQIVEKAIESISDNYPSNPNSYVGYYRDYKLIDDEYFNLNECLVEVFDGGLQTHKFSDPNNQAVLYNFHVNENFKRDEYLETPYDNKRKKFIKGAILSPLGGNELSILNAHNPIRNHNDFSFSFMDIFKKDFVSNHSFKFLKRTSLNDTPIYEIQFEALRTVTEDNYKISGKLFIETTNFSIHKIEYEVLEVELEIINPHTAKPDDLDIIKTYKPFYSLKLEYAPLKDKMYLNYISFNNHFQLKNKARFKVEKISYDNERNAFLIQFNNPLVASYVSFGSGRKLIPASNKIKNYVFNYKKRKLKVKNIEMINYTLMRVNLKDNKFSEELSDEGNITKHLKYQIRNLRDVFDRKLNKTKELEIYQFREFFVQEVFPNKELPSNIEFVNKTLPLSQSKIHKFEAKNKYWINTPLQVIKD
ncbi:hypothetical protein D7030_06380 [Flavobacteriaceae bacterium AU392]|nr:hypothetical protein D1817_02040 [Flavobacteriaceae bacterium]RKM84761.1 hypothetical protein D7030_06380 [Flavobacteriaceae bacterium AU392]